MSELFITTSQVQGDVSVTILHLKGHLHGATERELTDRASQSYEDGSKYLLLDLSELDVLASAGLRAIQNIFKLITPPGDMETIQQHGDELYKSPYLKLVCPNPHIYYILSITGFLQNLFIYNNMEDAIKSYSS
jgi:anti-anti-sigma factor